MDPVDGTIFLWTIPIYGSDTTVMGHAHVNDTGGGSSMSDDYASSWNTLSTGGPANAWVRRFKYWSITKSDGRQRYFRFAYLFFTSFFASNPTIYPGYVDIEYSDDKYTWGGSQKQRIYEWPHLPDAGVGSRAALEFYHQPSFLIPGSGPGGEDAHWMLMKVNVGSSAYNPVNDNAWWYTIDDGVTWVRDRTEPTLVNPQFIRRAANGRLIAGDVYLSHSDDDGLTWSNDLSASARVKTHLTLHPGLTACAYHLGGLASQVGSEISCDNGASWEHVQDLGVTDTAGYAIELGGQEALFAFRATTGFPTTTAIYYTKNAGESWVNCAFTDKLVGGSGQVIYAAKRPDGKPMIFGRDHGVIQSTEAAPGDWATRTVCSLASNGFATVGPPNLCGLPIMNDECY